MVTFEQLAKMSVDQLEQWISSHPEEAKKIYDILEKFLEQFIKAFSMRA